MKMWPFKPKISSRRKEIRRTRVERGAVWYRRLPGHLSPWTVALTLFAAVAAALILNSGDETLDFRVGQYLPRAVTSRVQFTVVDEKKTLEVKTRVAQTSPVFYRLDDTLVADLEGRLMNAIALAKANIGDREKLILEANKAKLQLDEGAATELLRLAELPDDRSHEQRVQSVIKKLTQRPLVEDNLQARQRSAALEAVLAYPGGAQQRLARNALIPVTEEAVRTAAREATQSIFPESMLNSMQQSIVEILRDGADAAQMKPLFRYDSQTTVQEARAAEDRVEAQVNAFGKEDVLAPTGVLTPESLDLLRAEHKAYLGSRPDSTRWGAIAGRSVLAFLIVIGVAAYIAHFQHRRIAADPLRQTTTALTLLLALAIARVTFLQTGATTIAVGAHAFAAALLVIIFAHGSVFAITGALALLITLGTQKGVGFCTTLLAVSGVLLFGLRDVRHRGKIVLVGASAAIVALFSSASSGMINGQSLSFAVNSGIWAGAATIAAAFVIEGVLPGIERLFRLSTSMTLLEWCDPNKVLLRTMAAEAPGTYNHSLLVGALATEAAEAIGANGLLARAGAYYHDIGKVNKPEYFVENQTPGANPHDRLSPAMSLLIIIGHVKDGAEMAREYGLPASLRPFITEHHGTTLVEYFYHAATKARQAGDPQVQDSEFRYPGPKPQSRETAIVMLCDGVEGAVRAMSEPTPGRIENVVSQIIQKRLIDGQLDESDLTFREVAIIERSLVKTLCGIYHARIEYPERTAPAAIRASSA